MWHHPKYYKELRKRNNGHGRANLNGPRVAGARSLPASDQAISDEASTEATSVRPDPGLKLQASSDKHQASSSKLVKPQATSFKPRG
jgi:hypothetical protein